MFNRIKKYKPFIRAGIQEGLFYKTNFIFLVIGNILSAFIMYFLWKAVFISSSSQSINGFSFQDMTIYIFLSFFTTTITSSNKSREISDEIRDGSISLKLLKPLNFSLLYLFTELGSKLIESCLIALPILGGVKIYEFFMMGSISFNPMKFFIYIITVIIGYFINFYFNICYSFLAFIFNNLWGTNLMKNCLVNLLSGAVVPLSFLPNWLGELANSLPFSSLNYTPVMIFLGRYKGNQIWEKLLLQLFWLLFFIGLSKVIWYKVVKYLNIQGG